MLLHSWESERRSQIILGVVAPIGNRAFRWQDVDPVPFLQRLHRDPDAFRKVCWCIHANIIPHICVCFQELAIPPTYQNQAVTQGDLALTINATGPVQSPATYNLVAASTSKIDA